MPKNRKIMTDAERAELPSSLFLLSGSNFLRRGMVWFSRWILFEWIIILTIIANCIVMALDEHLPNGDKTILAIQLEELEPVFMAIFTVEMVVKILADGFILHKGSYLRNPWNIMDFIVVVSGFLPYLIPASEEDGESGPDLSTLRTFRVLRPLKLVSGVPSLQVVMSAIGKAIGPLVNIALLLLFAIIIFAIIGLEFYGGALNKTCYDLSDLTQVVHDSENGNPCHEGLEATAPIGSFTCNPNNSICIEKWEGPNSGITSFDNIGLAMLTVFQCVTMEGWTPILYWTNDALGSVFNWVFFIPLIVVGSFFMLNLVLGVLSGEFAKEKERVESRAGFMQLKEQQKLEKELNGYVEWICRAEDLVLAEERTTEDDRKLIMEARQKAAEKMKKLSRTKTDSVESNSMEDGGEGGRDGKDGSNPEFWKNEKRFRFFIRRICKTSAWFWFVIVLVFLNTCTVAVEHYNQPQWLTEFLFYVEFMFLGAFIFEMSIRCYALGPMTFFGSSFNRFDSIVITGSVFEVFWVNFHERAGSFGLSALRALRLLRVFKVTKYWASLRNLVIALMNAIASILSLLFLLFLFIFIFALLGMQLFGGYFNFPEGTPLSNFNSITAAMLTVFQILTGEDWNQVMYTAINSKGGRENGGLVYCFYFVMLTLCGDYTLLNVFLAIACDSLDQAAALTEAEEAEKERQREAAELALNGGEGQAQQMQEPEEEIDPIKAAELAFERAAEAAARAAEQGEIEEEEDTGPKPILPYSSFFILSSTNPLEGEGPKPIGWILYGPYKLRCMIHWIVTKKIFDLFIMFVIVLSSIALAAEDPVSENSERNKVLGFADYWFTAIFTLEVLLKMIDLGFVLHPGAYLRDFWNFMDITVVSCALISFYHTLAGTPTGQKLKSLKLLRVLRPLKTINRVPKLKAVFDCVVISLKNVFNILIVYILFQFIFAVVGVQLFNGKFFYCTDLSKHTAEECQGYYFMYPIESTAPPMVVERAWERRPFHYDNVFMAMLTLFAVQTSEGWVAILQDSMSSTYEEEGPKPWFRVEMAIFYIVFFVVFPFFFVNIFVALIIVTFNELGEAELQDDMDKNQKSCIDFAIQAKPLELYVPEEQSGIRYHIWRLVTSGPFENFIMLLIVCNTILLMLKYNGAPWGFTEILSYFNLVFTALFTVECAFKLMSFGPKNYFKDTWNTFDFITVVGSIIDATKMVQVGFLKLFRAARLIKLLRRSVSVRILLYTFVQSFKALPYVCMLMGMLFFIYAIVGMQLFGSIIMDSSTSIERHNNFRHIFQSLMLLFRCATGEAWPDIMLDATAGRECDPENIERNATTGEPLNSWQNCGSVMTYVYFVSFIFLCSFIMLNLFVAVIMDNFDYLTRDSSILGSHHLGEFISTWSEFDPSGSGKIHYTEIFDMLRNIDPPLGFGKKCPERLAYKKLIRMNMPMDFEGKVHFTSTLFALIRENLKINVRESSEMDQADIELRTTIVKCWPHTKRDKIDLLVPPPKYTGVGKLTVGKLYGGILIHENWRNTKFSSIDELRKQEEEMEEIERQEALKAAEHAVTENADRGSSYEVTPSRVPAVTAKPVVPAEKEAEERIKQLENDNTTLNVRGDLDDNYVNEADFFDAPGRQQMRKMPPIMEQGCQEDYYAQWNDPWNQQGGNQQNSGVGQKQNGQQQGNWLQPNRSDLYQRNPQVPHPQNTHLPGYYDSYYPPNNVSGFGREHLINRLNVNNFQGRGRGARKLPQTPKTPSTLPTGELKPQFSAIDPPSQDKSKPMNGYIPSYFSSFSQPNMFGRLNGGVSNNSQQTNNLKANQVTATHLSGQGHRRLPATPNKPSTLFTQTASMAFQNFSHQFTKPSSLMIRQPGNGVVSTNSPSYGAFSFPKLNGSPSRPSNNPMHSNMNGVGNGGMMQGSGTGFMGFGPTGFTTPIDTVLDRFGRTGTIFPSANHHVGMNGSVLGVPSNYGPGMTGNTPMVGNGGPSSGLTPHRTLPAMVNRSNSLGRSLPPIPSKPPPLVRRRTFEDEDDRRMDWI